MPLDSNGATTDEELVCYCMVVSRERLERAVREGARTIRELSEATGAGMGCGTCRIDLAELLRRAGAGDDGPGSPTPRSRE